MGYVDLRRRRYERKSGGLSQYPGSRPHLLLAVGFALGVISSALFCITFGDPNPVGALLLLAAVITLLGYLGWLICSSGVRRDQAEIGCGETATHSYRRCRRRHFARGGCSKDLAYGGQGGRDPHPPRGSRSSSGPEQGRRPFLRAAGRATSFGDVGSVENLQVSGSAIRRVASGKRLSPVAASLSVVKRPPRPARRSRRRHPWR